MKRSGLNNPVIAGTPLIAEGNLVDNRSILKVLSDAGIPGFEFYPAGLFVRIAAASHRRMSMSTKKTMAYSLHSEAMRSSIMVRPLKWELKRAIKKALTRHANAKCFITSQSMMAEESAGLSSNILTVMASSDVSGKYNINSKLSYRQRDVVYLLWNKEAFDLYKNKLGLKNVYLIRPVDLIHAFEPVETSVLPFRFALDNPDICFIKLSGSGGDPSLVNAAITSLWKNSGVRSIVFPGAEQTGRKIITRTGNDITVNISLDTSAFYHHARNMISNRHMLLVYPSEQVKHIVLLTQNKIFPKVVWLPPRGVHEIRNMAWAIEKGFSNTICIPANYNELLKKSLASSGTSPSLIKCIEPEKLSAEHFKPSPAFETGKNVPDIASVLKKIISA
jgi:hypothetical protein